MRRTTRIDLQDFTISSEHDDLVLGMDLCENTNILYLPIQVGVTFPNLSGYKASRCSIKAISYQNFEGLSKLQYITLYGNQIEKIPYDAFEDLKNLQQLSLGRKHVFIFCIFLSFFNFRW